MTLPSSFPAQAPGPLPRPRLTIRAMLILLIIIIGWLYVTLLMALSESSLVAGVLTFVFYGLAPCVLPFWLLQSKIRRQRRLFREALAAREEAPEKGEV